MKAHKQIEPKSGKDIVVKTDLPFEELMKKALNTPLPKKAKKIKRSSGGKSSLK